MLLLNINLLLIRLYLDNDFQIESGRRMLKDKNQLVFEDKWPSMRPTILKLLRQEAVTRAEWHDLFWLVHSVCLWDDKVKHF